MAGSDEIITLTSGEIIPVSTLEFFTSRSGGPGGQNVNKVETKVEVRFVIEECHWISDDTKARLIEKLAGKIDGSGAIRVASTVERTQRGNKIAAIERLERLLNAALKREKPRRATRPTAASKQRRARVKRERSEAKASRRWRPEE